MKTHLLIRIKGRTLVTGAKTVDECTPGRYGAQVTL